MNHHPTPKLLQNIEKNIAADRWIRLLSQKRFRKLTEEFCGVFQHFADFTYRGPSETQQKTIDRIVSQFFFVMTQPSYHIPPQFVEKLIELGPIIANVAAMSAHKTTDFALAEILRHPRNLHKILVLYSARNTVRLDTASFFKADPALASQWYFSFFVCPGSYADPVVHENMKRHVSYVDPALRIPDHIALLAYFNSTYIDNIGYRPLKEKINNLAQEYLRGVKIQNRPDGTIGVFTSKWYAASSVYRCVSKSVQAIQRRHRTELIVLGEEKHEIVAEGFAQVKKVKLNGLFLDLRDIIDNPYSAAFFPDIGMSFESLYLSNLRIAPVQFMTYGHPSSTFGSKIDYFIGGAALEIPEDAARNYSEKLVLIPGNGQPTIRPLHLDPEQARKNAKEYVRPDRVVINCPWSQDKTTFPLIRCLRKIADKAKAPVLFRLFPNEAVNRNNYFIPYVQDIVKTLGSEIVEIHQAFQQEYLTRLAAGDMALDSWPFNGYNTVIDSLILGIPMLTLQGRQCFERVGAELLERIGISALIAKSEDEYVEKAVQLIDNDNYRDFLTKAIQDIPLAFQGDDGEAFADAVDSIVEKGKT